MAADFAGELGVAAIFLLGRAGRVIADASAGSLGRIAVGVGLP